MNYFNKLCSNLWVLRSLPKIIYFNFKVLPFSQAVKLPIWLYKPRFGSLSGEVILDKNNIRPGIIRLGKNQVNLYPNSGIFLDIRGKIIFLGGAEIGNNSAITVSETGTLVFGIGFRAFTTIKIACYHSIKFGEDVLVGWDCLFMDTDFHSLTRNDGTKTKGFAPIIIGNSVWFGCGCKVFKNTIIPTQCVVSAQTIISEKVQVAPRTIIGNERSIVSKAEGYYYHPLNDTIEYNTTE